MCVHCCFLWGTWHWLKLVSCHDSEKKKLAGHMTMQMYSTMSQAAAIKCDLHVHRQQQI